MSRPLTVLDGGSGSTVYDYGQPGSQSNDTLITRNPAPAAELAKIHQLESDALGRLTSVCEVTTGTGSSPNGTCAQSTTKTGYWTKYAYDPMGNILTVVQNAQASTSLRQTRTYTYDWMNRLTSETIPEIGPNGNGSAYYTYDSGQPACGGFYYGDLAKRVDAAGNVICSTYDLLHRELTRTYPSGIYSSVTPEKHFIYDSATVNALTMANAKGRLAEAYTCFSPCTTKLTDIGQSYTDRGDIADVYESTPHSGTFYYHTAQTYWAHGLANQLSGNLGFPTITYSVGGKARVSAVSATSGQNPVSSVSYNSADLPTAINYGSGSGDADSYTFDPGTNRMTQYKFTVNSLSLTGNLGWNANGTLQTQNIVNGFNSLGTQNCAYIYDDIGRVTSANCGAAASQTFSYDAFGNLNKMGSPYSFQPIYSNTINRIASVGGASATYDGNGNATNDTFHTFSWDADGHPIAVDTGQSDAVSLSYDALGRMVEQNRAGVYTQIAYSPLGSKLALMNGQTLQKAMVPLPGKAFAIYNASGLVYYAHADLLGSIRLASTPARAKYFDTAYAPFGETYTSTGTLDAAYTGTTGDLSHRQDTVGGLYDFPAREYSTQGRWTSPDPIGKDATCPKNPQTQNRYAYVHNNPLTFVDPTGTVEECGWFDPSCFGGGGGGGGGFCGAENRTCNPCEYSLDPYCGQPILRGGGGGGRLEKPRPFPWPLLPIGLFLGQENGRQTLQLTRAACTEYQPGKYKLECKWSSPTQTFTAVPAGPCYLNRTAYGVGRCASPTQAYDTMGEYTISCAPEITIDMKCDEFSSKGPYFNIVKTRLVPPPK